MKNYDFPFKNDSMTKVNLELTAASIRLNVESEDSNLILKILGMVLLFILALFLISKWSSEQSLR